MSRPSKSERYEQEEIARKVTQLSEVVKSYRKAGLDSVNLASEKLRDMFANMDPKDYPKEAEQIFVVSDYLHLAVRLLDKAEELDSD